MNDVPIRIEEKINGQGNLLENGFNLGKVSYEIYVYKRLPNLLNFNVSNSEKMIEDGIEIKGHLYIGSIDVFGKDFILELNDGRSLSVKLEHSGTIDSAKFI